MKNDPETFWIWNYFIKNQANKINTVLKSFTRNFLCWNWHWNILWGGIDKYKNYWQRLSHNLISLLLLKVLIYPQITIFHCNFTGKFWENVIKFDIWNFAWKSISSFVLVSLSFAGEKDLNFRLLLLKTMKCFMLRPRRIIKFPW